MTNEELAIRAKAHEDLAVLELWEAVYRLIGMYARIYLAACDYDDTRVEYEDLTQDGFIAMMDAVELFDPERGTKFTTILGYTIRKRFAEEGGHRSQKQQRSRAIQRAESLNAPLYQGEEDGDSKVDALADPCGEYAFALVEFEDYIVYTRRLINAAMDCLTSGQRESIEKHYLQGLLFDDIAKNEGCKRQAVQLRAKTGLYLMRRGRYRRELRAALRGFEDFSELQYVRRRAVELHAIAKQAGQKTVTQRGAPDQPADVKNVLQERSLKSGYKM